MWLAAVLSENQSTLSDENETHIVFKKVRNHARSTLLTKFNPSLDFFLEGF